jgi:Ca2+:H+ antiporter
VTGPTGDRNSQEKDAPTLAGSEDAINISRDIDGEEGGPRRRKTGLSGAPTEADDAASSASNGKPVYTVAGQLRAIFGSPVNILLVLVPVGSMFNSSLLRINH